MAYFSNKRIWITGGSSGIGEALAVAFAKHGARLILSARSESGLKAVAEKCRVAGAASVDIFPLDLANHASIPKIAEEVLEKNGKLDILVNNGGVSQRALAAETKLEVDKRLMDVNFFGTVALTKAVLPSMLEHDLGHIVTITSLTGKFGTPYRSSYAASKHAVHGFFDSLRAELGYSPIKITLICPGFVQTDISRNALTGDGSRLGTMDDATKNGMKPEDLAENILDCIQRGKEEAHFGSLKERFALRLHQFFPRIFAKVLIRAKVR